MASLDSLSVKSLLKKGVVRQVTNDKAIAMRLKYIGTGTVTSVTVVTATSIAMVTSDGGTDTYLFSAYSTMGALEDAINADAIFEARVIDALRSEDPDDSFLACALTATNDTDSTGAGVFDLYFDTSGAATFAICLSPYGIDTSGQPDGHRVHLREIKYFVDNTAAVDALKVYQRTKNGTETLLFSMLNVDATDTTITFASGEGIITSDVNAELIVFFDGTVVDHASNAIRVVGERE